MRTVSKKNIIPGKRFKKFDIANVFSIFVIIFLSSAIIIASALITDLIIRMATGKEYSVVYRTTYTYEEPKTMTVNL